MRLYCICILVAILSIAISASTQIQNAAMPDLIGMQKEDANATLRNANLIPNFIYKYNNTVQKYFVISQEYPAGTEIESQQTIDIVISSGPKPVTIDNLKKFEHVNGTVFVYGSTSSSFPEDGMIWIVVKPLKAKGNYWPQSGGPIRPDDDGTFNGVAFLGGDKNDHFDIVVLVLNQTISKAFENYIEACSARNNWPPITEEGNGYETISKEVIEAQPNEKVSVILSE